MNVGVTALALAACLAVCWQLWPVAAVAVRFRQGRQTRDLLIVAAVLGWVGVTGSTCFRLARQLSEDSRVIDAHWAAVTPDLVSIASALVLLTCFRLARPADEDGG